MSDTHEMYLAETYSDGSELWKCSKCEYSFVMNWPPNYSKDVILRGDPEATHTGGKGGIEMSGKASRQNPDGVYLGPEDEFDQWLKGNK